MIYDVKLDGKMIVMVMGNDLEEGNHELREDYPCNYISALAKTEAKYSRDRFFFPPSNYLYVPAEYISEL